MLSPDGIVFVDFMPLPAFALRALLSPRRWALTETADTPYSPGTSEESDLSPPTQAYYLCGGEEIAALLRSSGIREEEQTAGASIAHWLTASVWERLRERGRDAFDDVLALIAETAEDRGTISLSRRSLFVGRRAIGPRWVGEMTDPHETNSTH